MYLSETGSKRPPTDEELSGIFIDLDRLLCDNETPSMSESIEDFKKELIHTSKILKTAFKHDCYVCEVCDKDFKSKHRLNQHMENHIQTFRCHYCQKHCQTAAELKKHLTEHEKKVYSCKHCSKTYEFRRQLTAHLKKHVEQNRTFTCQFCKLNKAVFSTERELHKHISKKHKHCCKDCMKNFMTKIGLETHRVRNHGAYEQFNCGICKRRFEDCVCLTPLLLETCIHNTPINLMNIIGSVADSECSRLVNQFLDIKQHRLQNSTFKTRKLKKTPKITCKRCFKSFATSKLYKQHRRLMGCKKIDLYKHFKKLQLQDEQDNTTPTSDSAHVMNTQNVTGNTVGCDKDTQQCTEMECKFESSESEESCNDAQEETDSTLTP